MYICIHIYYIYICNITSCIIHPYLLLYIAQAQALTHALAQAQALALYDII
jgi:hypothetical protein